jgi:altronate dehydratase large subunit
LLSEITEFLGTEDVVSQRCANDDVRDRMLGLLKRQQVLVDRELGSLAHMVISPGNHDGGISTIQEKSLGCIRKGGTSPIQDVLQYAERPKVRGLNVMNTPGSDVFSMTGKIAGGAQILLFTTGRGSPAGSPLAPVIKISTNTALREHMPDDIDYDAGPVITGMALSDCAAGLIATVGEVANGKSTAAELTRTDLFAIHTTGPAL